MNTIQKPKIQQQKSHIPRILLSLAFFLIIFAAQFSLSNKITAHAAEVTIEGTDWAIAPNGIEWGGSAEKQGLLFYLYNIEQGRIDYSVDPFCLAASSYSEGEAWQYMVSGLGCFYARKGSINAPVYTDTSIPYPATYTEDGRWISTGSDTKAYLEEELPTGRQRWESIIGTYWGYDKVNEIKKDKGETYRICMESVSAFIPYKSIGNDDYQMKNIHGGPYRAMMPNRYAGQLYAGNGIDITKRTGSSSTPGTANYKWLQSIGNGMVFVDEEDAALIGVDTVADSGSVSATEMYTKGYGFGTIKPTLTPIHTCNGSTPGDPERPIPDVTDGECKIFKLYYTIFYDKDGNEIRKEYLPPYSMPRTTNYIVIDSERGYTVEGWKGSRYGGGCSSRDAFYAIPPYSDDHRGKGGGSVTLDDEHGEKYLYVLLKKTEIEENPEEPTPDYLIPESQITKRISLDHPDNLTARSTPLNTISSHVFNFRAGGVGCPGHEKKVPCINYCNPGCTPVDTDGDGEDDSSTCPGHPGTKKVTKYCSGGDWSDNDTKIGLINTASSSSSILSKIQQCSLSEKGDTISPTGNTKDLSTTRSGTGTASLSYSGYSFNSIIFRGKDQLVLADWKNAASGGEYLAAKSFLGNISTNSSYNFKSANTPNGTRYHGNFYYDKFGVNFTNGGNGEQDEDTVYQFEIDHGCGSKSSSFSLSNPLSINDIIARVEVYWGEGDGVSGRTGRRELYAGTVSFIPYILMRYDTETQRNKHTFVLSEHPRSLTVYDAATVSVSNPEPGKISLISSQWSTHASASKGIASYIDISENEVTDAMKESILPGGATLSLSIAKNAVRKVTIKTAQAYLPSGSAGYNQAYLTNERRLDVATSLKTNDSAAKSAHNNFVNSVRSAFMRTRIKQYISSSKTAIKNESTSSILSTGKMINPGEYCNLGSGSGFTASKDSKYYFDKYNDSQLDVSDVTTNTSYVTFGLDSHGGFWYAGTDSNGIRQVPEGGLGTGGNASYILNNTNIRNQIESALLKHKGNDSQSDWGTQWYNEAFDGVTYIYQESYFYVGLINPTERITVLDPKSTPIQNSKDDLFDKFYASAFITHNPSNRLGTFRNAAGKGKSFSYNFNNLYRSKPFYIPNVTTQDLN